MAFAVMVEVLNLKSKKKKSEVVHLRQAYTPDPAP